MIWTFSRRSCTLKGMRLYYLILVYSLSVGCADDSFLEFEARDPVDDVIEFRKLNIRAFGPFAWIDGKELGPEIFNRHVAERTHLPPRFESRGCFGGYSILYQHDRDDTLNTVIDDFLLDRFSRSPFLEEPSEEEIAETLSHYEASVHHDAGKRHAYFEAVHITPTLLEDRIHSRAKLEKHLRTRIPTMSVEDLEAEFQESHYSLMGHSLEDVREEVEKSWQERQLRAQRDKLAKELRFYAQIDIDPSDIQQHISSENTRRSYWGGFPALNRSNSYDEEEDL